MIDLLLTAEDDKIIVTEGDDAIVVSSAEGGSDYFQRMVLRVVPPWLTRANGRALLQSIAAVYDLISDETDDSAALRFPDASREDALAVIGGDRLIARGPLEGAASYAERLRGWLSAHKNRGGPYALLGQLRAFFVGQERRIDLVYGNGTRYVLHPDGSITYDSVPGWRADSDPAKWAIATLVHYLDEDPGALTQSERDQYLTLPRDWSAAHVLPIGVGLAWDGAATVWGYPWELTWGELDAMNISWGDFESRGVF